jgi:GAF domain-containing protein
MASVRIYDPFTSRCFHTAHTPLKKDKAQPDSDRRQRGRIAITTRKPVIVPDILREKLYTDKTIVDRKGVNSLMAIPFEIPRFFPHERNTTGVIQIYYAQKERIFAPLEAQVATLMSQRLGFVIARKKILTMAEDE